MNGGSNQSRERAQNGSLPRAVIHKKILDAARSRPEDSIQDLATNVDGASEALVDRVLHKYGDPGDHEADDETEIGPQETDDGETESPNQTTEDNNASDPAMTEIRDAVGTEAAVDGSKPTGETRSRSSESDNQKSGEVSDGDEETATETDERSVGVPSDRSGAVSGSDRSDGMPVPDPDQLTQKQLDVLRAIREQPQATQAELADRFDISRATISQRVNAIDGFEWRRRQEFVDAVLGKDGSPTGTDGLRSSVRGLEARIDNLARRIGDTSSETEAASDPPRSSVIEPELVAKQIRACIESETITDEEEVQIITGLMEAGRR